MVEMIGSILDVVGLFLMGVATVLAVEALRKLAGWRTDREVVRLERRLADVEALRRTPPDVEAMRSALTDAAVLFREYERLHVDKLNGAEDAGQVGKIIEKATRNAQAARRCEAALKARAPLDPETATRTVGEPWQGTVPRIIAAHIGREDGWRDEYGRERG